MITALVAAGVMVTSAVSGIVAAPPLPKPTVTVTATVTATVTTTAPPVTATAVATITAPAPPPVTRTAPAPAPVTITATAPAPPPATVTATITAPPATSVAVVPVAPAEQSSPMPTILTGLVVCALAGLGATAWALLTRRRRTSAFVADTALLAGQFFTAAEAARLAPVDARLDARWRRLRVQGEALAVRCDDAATVGSRRGADQLRASAHALRAYCSTVTAWAATVVAGQPAGSQEHAASAAAETLFDVLRTTFDHLDWDGAVPPR